MPRVNPDGAERFSRGSMDFSAPQTSADCLRADGTLNPAKLDQHLGANVTAFTNADGQHRLSYDINHHWTDWSKSTQIRCNPGLASEWHFNPGQNPAPGAVALRGIHDRYRPIWLVDVHNQNPAVVITNVDPEVNRPGRPVTGSIPANLPRCRPGSGSTVEAAGNRDEAALHAAWLHGNHQLLL
ncbi:hypothetical protein ACBG90_13790 [Stutzerimonas kunmingensis]|uniref:hypothetical protein n=1 Tax=Stutzerimonas kunmingensis TaxID=1211807 RepID=UPI00352363A2